MTKSKFATQITLILITIISFAVGCTNDSSVETTEINQVSQLTDEEALAFKTSIIRLVGRKPENASHENKYNTYFDAHYAQQAETHYLEYYLKNEDKTFFVLTRIAPSIELKHVGIGGYVRFNQDGSIAELEEVFRTWKRKPEELKPILDVLFSKMVNGEDLTMYYTAKMGLDAYIEFPNEEVWYDKTTNTWASSREDVLKEFYDDKVARTQIIIDSLERLNDTINPIQ
jgi:hypothetical protein